MLTQKELISCIELALQEGAVQTAKKLIGFCAQSEHNAPAAIKPPVLNESLRAHRLTTPSEIYIICCQFLQTLRLGDEFNFCYIADYVQTRPGIALDSSVNTSERREKWRNNVSQALDKLRARGFLEKADKNASYRVKRYP